MESINVKFPEDGIVFLSQNEFWEFYADYSRNDRSCELEGVPDFFPCIGFPVYRTCEYDRRDKVVFAFIYLAKADQFQKSELLLKSEVDQLSKLELAILQS